MWRIEPKSALVVSVKRNPGQSHRPRASMQGVEPSAAMDDRVVWQGALGAAASGLQGPPGVRSDNAQLLFELSADARRKFRRRAGLQVRRAGIRRGAARGLKSLPIGVRSVLRPIPKKTLPKLSKDK